MTVKKLYDNITKKVIILRIIKYLGYGSVALLDISYLCKKSNFQKQKESW